MGTPLRFPELELRDLHGTKRSSPACFQGARNLVFVAFRRSQQDAVDEWVDRLGELPPGWRLWEVPAISRIWSPLRGAIDGGMAVGVGTDEIRARTLTYYGDLRRLTRPLGIERRSAITVLLLDDEGRLLRRAEGPWSEAGAAELLDGPA